MLLISSRIRTSRHPASSNAAAINHFDSLYGLNDFDLRWVAYSNWTYSSEIAGLYGPTRQIYDPQQSLTGYRETSEDVATYLVFNGLDTYATIEFCGEYVASTDNQFRQYVFDISDFISSCDEAEPLLTVNFGAAPNITEAIANEPDQETWPSGVNGVYEFPNRWFARKQQSDFGWYGSCPDVS